MAAELTIVPSGPSVTIDPPATPGIKFEHPAVPAVTFMAPDGATLVVETTGPSVVVDGANLPAVTIEAPTRPITMGVPIPIGGGESNTASSVGGGASVVDGKVGTDIRLRTLVSLTAGLTLVENIAAQTVDVEHRIGFSASCQAADTIGDVVYLTASGISGTPDVTGSDISDIATMPVVGVIAVKQTPVSCFVQTSGVIDGFIGLSAGGTVLASAVIGGMTQTKPSTPGQWVQRVGIATSPTEILIDPSPPIRLS